MKKPLLLSAFVTSLLLSAAPAFADLAPPDACTSVGSSCANAGPNYDQPGMCTASTCNKALPDGGTYEYSCNKCVASTAGGGGSTAAGGTTAAGGYTGTGNATSTGGKKSGGSDDSGGCSLRAPGENASALIALGLLGLGALALRRTKK